PSGSSPCNRRIRRCTQSIPVPAQSKSGPSPAPASCGECRTKGGSFIGRTAPTGDPPAIVEPLAMNLQPTAREKAGLARLTDAPIDSVSLRALQSEIGRHCAAAHEMSHRCVRYVVTTHAASQQPLLNLSVFAGADHVPAGAKPCVETSDAANVRSE